MAIGAFTETHLSTLEPLSTQRPEVDAPSNWLVRALHWLDKRSPAAACLGGMFLIACIGVLSYATGPQFSCSLFYLIPILLVTRVAGFRLGFFASLLAAALWLSVDLSASKLFDHPVIPFWNATMRLGTFLVGVALVSAMRSLNTHLEERVNERTAALQAQFAEKRELERNILEISDREQVRLGQDLHDGLCQQLVSAAFSTTMLQQTLTREKSASTTDADHISEMIDDAITQARNLARGLYPVRLEAEGLEMALREMASTMSRRFGIRCSVDCGNPLPPGKPSTGIHLYRIAQESVTNAAKHSAAREVSITLSASAEQVKMVISDDGVGLDQTSRNPSGMGLSIMEYRARLIGASFLVHSFPNRGTKIVCILDKQFFRS